MQKEDVSKFILVLFPGIHFEKVRVANATFLLAQNSLTVGRYFPVSHVFKKDGSFVIMGENKKQKPLHRSHCIEPIATKPVQSGIVFFQSNPFLFASHENSNNLICLWFIFNTTGFKHNNNCFFDLHRKCYPRSLHPPLKLVLQLSSTVYLPIY